MMATGFNGDKLSATAPVRLGEIVTPGQVLTKNSSLMAGSGAYPANGVICAGVCGRVRTSRGVIFVESAFKNRRETLAGGAAGTSVTTLKVGDLVTARVTRIDRTRASLDILCLEGEPLAERFAATLLQSAMKSVVSEVRRSYRPGDVVVAKILSLGDAKRYMLTTASEELGVIQAYSAAAGAEMEPVDFKHMRCPVTGVVEEREVAKPVCMLAQQSDS